MLLQKINRVTRVVAIILGKTVAKNCENYSLACNVRIRVLCSDDVCLKRIEYKSLHGATYFVAVTGDDSASGTINRPWATINHAARVAQAGDLVVVRGGRYILSAQVRPYHSGRSDAWITFVGYPGEKPILDAERLPHSMLAPQGLDNGAFQIEGVSHIRVANLTIINSHDAGFTVRDSNDIDLINNSTEGTYSSGIAVWDTNHDGKGTERIRIIGNTITKATTWNLFSQDIAKPDEPPHEAISIGGAVEFEVAYNHIYDSDKEGIDIKETSKRGKVHHNYVHHIDRTGYLHRCCASAALMISMCFLT